MADLNTGVKAVEGEMTLNTDGDFVTTLHRKDDSDWPAGTEISYRMYSDGTLFATWPATVTGPDASFAIDKVLVNDFLAEPKPWKARLYYTQNSSDIVLAVQAVVKQS